MRLEKELAEKEIKVNELRSSVESKEREVKRLEEAMASAEKENASNTNALNSGLLEKNDEIKKLNETIFNNEKEIAKLTNELCIKKEELEKISNELCVKKEEIEKLTNDYHANKEEKEKITGDLELKGDELKKISSELSSTKAEKERLENELKDKEGAILELESVVLSCKNKETELSLLLSEKDKEIARLETHHSQVQSANLAHENISESVKTPTENEPSVKGHLTLQQASPQAAEMSSEAAISVAATAVASPPEGDASFPWSAVQSEQSKLEPPFSALCESVALVLREIRAYLGTASGAARDSLLHDAESKQIVALVRGKLSTALVKLLLHRFNNEKQESIGRKYHVWDAFESLAKKRMLFTFDTLT